MAPALKAKKGSSKHKQVTENNEWVLEGIAGYLHSPSWTTPIENFFDEHCSCFENKEENKLEYTDIHIRYKKLVENLLAQYIKELQISEELFSLACKQHNSTIDGVEKMFERIWAADDFLLFKRLMIKHNIDLEMQTLAQSQLDKELFQLTTENYAYNPNYEDFCDKGPSTSQSLEKQDLNMDESNITHVLTESKEDYATLVEKARALEEQEAEDLRRAIEFSKQEMERLNAEAEKEKQMLEEAIRLSLECCALNAADESSQVPITPASAQPPVVPTASGMSSTIVSARKPQSATKSDPNPASLPPLRQKTSSEAALDWLESAKEDADTLHVESSETKQFPDTSTSRKNIVAPADLAQRKHYLQEQRKKLLEKKKKERNEKLEQYEKKSPQANKKEVLNGNGAENSKMMQARRALADRLKREVIQKQK